MPLSIAVAALIASLVGTGAKLGADGVKTHKGKKMMESGEKRMMSELDQIKYTRPEEYGQIMSLLKGQVSGLDSRRESAEDRIESRTASSVTGISQLADSPVAALGAYGGLKEKEQQAIADLGLQYEGMKDQATMNVASGLEMGAGYSEKENYYNDMYKRMVKANMGASKMGAGTNMMWGGLDGIESTALDFIGTKYLTDIYAGKDGGGSKAGSGKAYDKVMGDTGD